MGWLRTLLLGDIGNRMDIADNESRIHTMRRQQRRRESAKQRKDRTQDQQIEALRTEVLDLQLTIGVLTTLLFEREVITAEALDSALATAEAEDEGDVAES